MMIPQAKCLLLDFLHLTLSSNYFWKLSQALKLYCREVCASGHMCMQMHIPFIPLYISWRKTSPATGFSKWFMTPNREETSTCGVGWASQWLLGWALGEKGALFIRKIREHGLEVEVEGEEIISLEGPHLGQLSCCLAHWLFVATQFLYLRLWTFPYQRAHPQGESFSGTLYSALNSFV